MSTPKMSFPNTQAGIVFLTLGLLMFPAVARGENFFVTSLNPDADPGGIFRAVVDANTNPGTDDIVFNIGSQTIQTTSDIFIGGETNVRAIGGRPTLDGSTNPFPVSGIVLAGNNSSVEGLIITGYGDASIEIRGSNNIVLDCELYGSQFGVRIFDFAGGGDSNQIGDLLFENFIHSNTFGIAIEAGAEDNTITDNVIGIDPLGFPFFGNQIGISNAGDQNNIEHNIISANTNRAIAIVAEETIVANNVIGLSVDGVEFPNGFGISVSFGSTLTAIDDNIISGNSGTGIVLDGTGAFLTGNTIGLDASRTLARPNMGPGIELIGNQNRLGGTGPGSENQIDANQGHGIHIFSFATQNLIVSNSIGTVVGNGASGIFIEGPSNTIGHVPAMPSSTPTGNTIRNNSEGIEISGPDASGNLVDGNLIESNVTSGIRIIDASDNSVGSMAANRIQNNTEHGIEVDRMFEITSRNSLRGNHITDNTMLGIALLGTAQDSISPPSVIQLALGVTGSGVSMATIDLYSDEGDEGEFLIATVMADGAGGFDSPGSLALWRGTNLTAIQTDPNGNTSAFSAPQLISASGPLPDVGDVICLDGLDAGQVVVGSASTATGTAAMSVTTAGQAVRFDVVHNVANATSASIHSGAAGVSGAIVLDLGAAGSPITANFDAAAFRTFTSDHYVLISSSAFPAGDIRGQINCPEPLAALQALVALVVVSGLRRRTQRDPAAARPPHRGYSSPTGEPPAVLRRAHGS